MTDIICTPYLRVAPPNPREERDGEMPLRPSSKSYATRREPEGGGELASFPGHSHLINVARRKGEGLVSCCT